MWINKRHELKIKNPVHVHRVSYETSGRKHAYVNSAHYTLSMHIILYLSYVESKKKCTTYLQNKNKVADVKNKMMVTRVKGGEW